MINEAKATFFSDYVIFFSTYTSPENLKFCFRPCKKHIFNESQLIFFQYYYLIHNALGGDATPSCLFKGELVKK